MSKGSGYVIAGAICFVAGSLQYIGDILGKKDFPGIVIPAAFLIALILIVKGWRMDKTA